MVSVGRALMSAPIILMLDEPSLGLSPNLCSELFRALAEIRRAGTGILLVEQNANLSLAIADRGYLLETGRITSEDTAEALENDQTVMRAYLGGATRIIKSNVTRSTTNDILTGEIRDLIGRAERRQKEHVEKRRAAKTGSSKQ